MLKLSSEELPISPVDGYHYRQMASRLRELACLTHSAGIRKELAALAKRYDGTADHLDDRSGTKRRRGGFGRTGGREPEEEPGVASGWRRPYRVSSSA